ncbi:engulfment and cell motility protein 1-like, partial [Micropterus salmoides]|uniref:engulfment and cell motility protein 1-like n=1 Tax=Micropterus salmoides TaxID=27706 RepID=UPI0018EB44BA
CQSAYYKGMLLSKSSERALPVQSFKCRVLAATELFHNSSKSVSSFPPLLPFSSCFLPDKFWYCRLSPNHKVLHYGDLEESPQGEVPHDSLQDKLPVADIKAVITGKDCPHMKEKGALKQNKEVLELAFSVLYESDEYLNFIAPDKNEYCVWTDGLNALLGKEMTSDYTKSDMDTLLSMEMKLRLLDLENIQIPEAPPPIPKEPSNYDFVYDCN